MSGLDDMSNDPVTSADDQPAPADPSTAATGDAPPVTGSDDARTLAGLVLEVLGGVRTPGEVAAVLGVAPARYYQLESRALAGLVAGCEPRPRGPQIDYRTRWERERDAVAVLKQEIARLTALLRTAQQTYGVRPMPSDRKRLAQTAKRAGKRAKRKPSVRALKARERLDGIPPARRRSRRQASDGGAGEAPASPSA